MQPTDVELTHLPEVAQVAGARPPDAIPVQAGRQYFRLEPDGEHWDAISAALTVGIHVSPGLPKLNLELLAVKQ